MAAERLSMRTIKEVLRLTWEKKLSKEQIAKSCNIAHSTIRDYLERAQHAGRISRGAGRSENPGQKIKQTIIKELF